MDLPADAYTFMADTDTLKDFGQEPQGYQNLARILSGISDANPPTTANVTKSDFLFYIYTSGTTGMPKASITNHERWLAAHAGFGHVISGMRSDDIFYLTLPLYHATGMLVCWGAVVAGPAAVVIRRRFSASEFWKEIHHYRCTGFGYVGELCRYLLNRPPQPEDAENPVRMMIGNGLRPAIWREFRERFAIDNIYEFYASSEGNVAFLNLFNMDNTIGFGGGNIALVKYDKEADQPVRDAQGHLVPADDGEAGLLLGKITKATPFVGYTQKEKTEAALLRNVFKEGDVYFNTGDLIRHIGCRHYQFVDRTGDTFRWKGENVSTTELESILSSHPHIEEAVVYGVQIPNTDGRAGMAAITPAIPESELDFQGLLAFVRRELPPFAVPIFLRLRQQMETTGTFKYKKTDLKTDGFDVNKVADPLYVWLPGTDRYVLLTLPIYQAIQNGEYRY
ncbi:MAG: long-chain-acyl-CoA synthetase [Candidatus Macondimonas sp.]